MTNQSLAAISLTAAFAAGAIAGWCACAYVIRGELRRHNERLRQIFTRKEDRHV